jgi:DNA-binding MarR family transcriptional regulator
VIKFTFRKNDGRQTLGFGLSRKNIELLMDGKPIHARLDELGLSETDVLMFFGETEEQMQQELSEHFGVEVRRIKKIVR